MSNSYQSCPECDATLVTDDYLRRYGRCKSCYDAEHSSIDQRIARALRR
jgi:protein-arginine kinase activator protein McsA